MRAQQTWVKRSIVPIFIDQDSALDRMLIEEIRTAIIRYAG